MGSEASRGLLNRLWQYQSERFPFFQHGLLIAAFSSSAVSVSALLRAEFSMPSVISFAVAFIVLFALFLHLRVADEYKDAEVDAKYRPERAVPRGLVTLQEIAIVGIIFAVIQLVVTVSFSYQLSILLLFVWVYLTLMTKEFFVAEWLRDHPMIYMVSHMIIMPIVDLFATACDWLVLNGSPPAGLIWFLVVSFFNGMIIEVGRKTWAPSMEKEGVESYSSAWGIPKAVTAWIFAILGSYACAIMVSFYIDFQTPIILFLGAMTLIALYVVITFAKTPDPNGAKRLENFSGAWILGVYLICGIIPLGLKVWA